MILKTIERLSEQYIKVDYQEELIQILREGIYNMNQKALINKFVLRVFDGEPCVHEYVALSNSGLTNNFEFENYNGKVEIDGIDVEFGPDRMINYTTDLISVDFGKGKDNITTTINYVKKSGLYVDLANKKCYFLISKGRLTDGSILIDNQNTIKEILSGCQLYKGYSWSNSEERNLRVTLVNASKYSNQERFEKLDKQLGGSLNYWIQQSLEFKSIQKLASRNGLQNPGALFVGELGNEDWGVLFIKSKIKGNSDATDEYNEYLKKRGIELDNFIIDGQHIKNAAWLVDVLYKHHNIQTSESVVAGIMEQERSVGIGNKSAGCFEHSDVFEKEVEYAKKNYKYVIIGNPNKIAAIHDTNSAKIPNYKGNGFRSMVLDIATAGSSASTSGQLLSKLMFIDKNATVNFLHQRMYNNLSTMTDVIVQDSEYSSQGSLSQMLFGLNESLASVDMYALTALGTDLMKYAKGAIIKSKIKVKGSNYRAQFENSFMIQDNEDVRFLGVTPEGYVECYNADVIAKNRRAIRAINNQYKEDMLTMSLEQARENRRVALNEIMVGMALKYPCPGNSEFELFRFMTNEEMRERIFENTIDQELASINYKYFVCRNGGCIVIANENILKHKLAGMDTDFDGLTVVLEEELVNIAKKAYVNGSITGSSHIPSYTVILNKIKRSSHNYNIVVDCVNQANKKSEAQELMAIKELNGVGIDNFK